MTASDDPAQDPIDTGQAEQPYDCPLWLLSHLGTIRDALDTLMANRGDSEYDSPFGNTGNVEGFVCPVFEVHAYDWDEDHAQPFNFRWHDLLISWYKHASRGTTMSRPITPDESAEMLTACIEALWTIDATNDQELN